MAQAKETSIDIMTVDHGEITFCILGTTPTICHRLSQKGLQELLMPKGKKTSAEKKGSLKHDPLAEFRAAPYLSEDPKSATLLQHLSSMFKGALRSAALDIPGANKSQIGRLTWVNGERIDLYGVPELFMSVTRSSDMNKTPDVRTRAIVPKWACRVTVSFVKPILNETAISNLLAFAGISQGIGDWRPQKGAGTYGQFKLVDANDPEFLHIIKHGGRKAQESAMENPGCYDAETREMYDWFNVESKRRGFKAVA